MNTAGLTYLGAKAKPIAEAIARWCEREGIGYEFLPARGGHPSVRLSLSRQTRKVFFSSSASDQRTILNVLQSVRKEARAMGWEPRKETPMEASVVKSLSELPKVVGPPDPVKSIVRRQEPPGPDGAPRPPDKQARNEWIFQKMEAGANKEDLARKLSAAGWDMKPQSVYAQWRLTRREKGFAPAFTIKRGRGRKGPAPTDKPKVPEAPVSPVSIAPLVLAIAEAIAPLIREQLAQQGRSIEALKAKADKWDAIAGLVKDA